MIPAFRSTVRNGKPWEPWEEEMVGNPALSVEEIAEATQRGVAAIQTRRTKTYGIRQRPAPRRWPKREPVPVTAPQPTGNPHGTKWMWQQGCACDWCRQQAWNRERRRKTPATAKRGAWSDEELDVLWDRTLSPTQVAEKIGRSPGQVQHARKVRGIKMQRRTVRRVGNQVIETIS